MILKCTKRFRIIHVPPKKWIKTNIELMVAELTAMVLLENGRSEKVKYNLRKFRSTRTT